MDALEHTELSEECLTKVMEVFNFFDDDHSQAIDKVEAMKHFSGAFSKISAKELFNSVDVDGDGTVTKEEWVTFWRVVKGSGHDEEDLMAELDNIKQGQSWCGFENLPKKYKHMSSNMDGHHTVPKE